MLQPLVDHFGWTVAGARPVEVGQYVSGWLAQGAAELGDLDQRSGDAALSDSISLTISSGPRLSRGAGRRRSSPLVDASGGLDLDVLIDGEQRRESGRLLIGEQVGTGMQGSPGTVERVVLTAAAAGRGGSSPLAVAEKKGTMILLAPGRARWASDLRRHSLPPLWLTWDLAGRGRWLAIFDPPIARQERAARSRAGLGPDQLDRPRHRRAHAARPSALSLRPPLPRPGPPVRRTSLNFGAPSRSPDAHDVT